MYGKISHEKEVSVPASEAWKLFGTAKLAKLVGKSLPDFFTKTEIVQGDGGAGTIIELFFPEGTPGMISFKEKFTMIDDSKRVKETEVIEGGYLDIGFTYFHVRFEVLEKEDNKNYCIMKITFEYEVKKQVDASLVSMQQLVLQLAADHLANTYI